VAQETTWAHVDVDVDITIPSAARAYDYYLGGAHNFAVDRELAQNVLRQVPNIKEIASANRAFLRRAVRYCVDRGITQFLDIGSGIPTAGNVHEIAQASAPEARVVYVDNESVAVSHSKTILEDNENATVLRGDLKEPRAILQHPETRRLLDFDQPIGLIMVALFHFVPDSAGPRELIRTFHERLAPGSHLCLSHVTGDHYPDAVSSLIELYEGSSNPGVARSREQVADLMADFELVEPGVAHVPEWHPDNPEDVGSDPARSIVYGAVGRKV
jgi:hypothetical protein